MDPHDDDDPRTAAESASARPAIGLSRDRLVDAALDLVQHDGLDALTMRALADRLHVKAASLYWHVRDRAELVRLIAAALLDNDEVALPGGGDWRAQALGVCTALEQATLRRRDAARLLLEAPAAVARSQAHARLAAVLGDAGLSAAEASETATLMLGAVLVSALLAPEEPALPTAGPLELVVGTAASRGVSVRAGSHMRELIRAPHDRSGFAPAVVRGDRVIVQRPASGRHAELELNPAHAWRFHVQAPTWNTTLNLLGLDVRGIQVDSGAVRVECILPPPRGSVPIHVSSGVVELRLRRPPGVAVVADISAGSVQLRLDGNVVGATLADAHWTSGPGAAAGDHYALKVSSGTVRVSLEEDASLDRGPLPPAPPLPRAGVSAALNVVLDGVAARASGR